MILFIPILTVVGITLTIVSVLLPHLGEACFWGTFAAAVLAVNIDYRQWKREEDKPQEEVNGS